MYTLTGEPPVPSSRYRSLPSRGELWEITQAEIGELKVGTHRTEYRWNGTDEYGQELMNGSISIRDRCQRFSRQALQISIRNLEDGESAGTLPMAVKERWCFWVNLATCFFIMHLLDGEIRRKPEFFLIFGLAEMVYYSLVVLRAEAPNPRMRFMASTYYC